MCGEGTVSAVLLVAILLGVIVASKNWNPQVRQVLLSGGTSVFFVAVGIARPFCIGGPLGCFLPQPIRAWLN